MSHLDRDNILWLAGREKGLRSKEGKAVFEEALSFLANVTPVPPLEPTYGLVLAARDHCADTGPKKVGWYTSDRVGLGVLSVVCCAAASVLSFHGLGFVVLLNNVREVVVCLCRSPTVIGQR